MLVVESVKTFEINRDHAYIRNIQPLSMSILSVEDRIPVEEIMCTEERIEGQCFRGPTGQLVVIGLSKQVQAALPFKLFLDDIEYKNGKIDVLRGEIVRLKRLLRKRK